MTLAPRSIKCLAGVHPDLVRVVHRADELGARFHVTCGLRTAEEQIALVRAKKSRTLKSRHLTGHAVDFVVAEPDGGVSYDHADMKACAAVFKQAAAELGVAIEWGGDWRTFVDTPHIELDRKVYKDEDDGSISKPDESISIPTVPAAPIAKSGTVWGTVAGALAGVGAFFEQTLTGLIEWTAKLTELAPAQAALASMSGNVKAISLGMGVSAAIYVISRRVKASQEGKPG